MRFILLLLALTFTLNLVAGETFIFIHGGPGFNSNPEVNLIAPMFEKAGHKFIVWNEPSALRVGEEFVAASAYQNALKSAEKFIEKQYEISGSVNIIAHSFGSHIARHLMLEKPHLIDRVIMVSPSLNQHNCDLNIFKIALNDLKGTNLAQAQILEKLIPNVVEEFNENKLNAYVVASSVPTLFVNYWANTQDMGEFFQYYSGQYAFDINSFIAVRSTMPVVKMVDINVPTLFVFGENDPVINYKDALDSVVPYFVNNQVTIIPGARHYSYITQKDKFFKLVMDFIK